MSSIDILNLEWPWSDRDLHIVTPVLVYLKKKYNLKAITKNIFHGYYYIWKYRPKLLVISNFSGADINHFVVKNSYNSGIRTISLISEGNVKPELADQFLWGWNKDKVLYLDKFLLWSKRSKKIFTDKYPMLSSRMIVTGATGFDRYKLLQFKSKIDFINEHSFEKYLRIIGIAGWGFDHFWGDYYEQHKNFFIESYGIKQIQMHREDAIKLRRIYEILIKNNPDILFILKYHPGILYKEKSEFYGLDRYENVYVIDNTNSKYKISDLINVSDLWIGYETTTALEAWLLGKTTFLINPTTTDFLRNSLHKGSPIVKTADEAQELIDEYFQNGYCERFMQLEGIRRKLIEDVIQYDDGKNHVRAANEIYKIYKQPDRKIKFNRAFYKEFIKQGIRIILAHTIARTRYSHFRIIPTSIDNYYELYDKVINPT